jgi:hypothetical protein
MKTRIPRVLGCGLSQGENKASQSLSFSSTFTQFAQTGSRSLNETLRAIWWSQVAHGLVMTAQVRCDRFFEHAREGQHMTVKSERVCLGEIVSAALHLNSQLFSGKGHYKFMCVNTHGVKGVLFGSHAADHSRIAHMNFRTAARRLARRQP